ncbi:hypothetical protein JCM11641_004876 [Rhodosporidiobolus odoratus]
MDAPAWPPSLPAEQEQSLISLSTDYSLAHGLIVRPFPTDSSNPSSISTTSAIHAPYALYPSPFPRDLFQQAIDLQPLYNALYARVTADDDFLEEVVGGAVAKVDEFQRRLYEIWKTVKKEGIKQPLSLGLFRSDYLLHSPPSSPSSLSIKQVEFNTISSSFGCLSTRVSALHRYLLQSGAYASDDPRLNLDALPENGALQGLAAGLAAAHKAYGREKAVVLMVTQDNERNAFDQRPLEYELVEKYGIRLFRIPLSQLSTVLSLAPSTSSTFPSNTLLLTHPSSPEPLEISLVYYRTAYSPTDYISTSNRDWDTRLLIERSTAIKCPSVAMQLAGSKKVQQVLADPAQLGRFFPSNANADGDGAKEEMNRLRESFTDLYPLDSSPSGLSALQLALEQPEKFVLKPQREGGGNNIYRLDIPPFLRSLEEADQAKTEGEAKGREGYILMSLIEPPKGREQIMVRAGEGRGEKKEVVSEVGIYGVVLVNEESGRVEVNETAGHLLRTKSVESDEGGIAAGFSILDSPLLV